MASAKGELAASSSTDSSALGRTARRVTSEAKEAEESRLRGSLFLRFGPRNLADALCQLVAAKVDAADDPSTIYQDQAVAVGVEGAVHLNPPAGHPDVRPVEAELLEQLL